MLSSLSVRLVSKSAKASPLLKLSKVLCGLRGVFRRGPCCEFFIGAGLVGALFYFEDDGVWFFNNHTVPDPRLEVDEGRFYGKEVA